MKHFISLVLVLLTILMLSACQKKPLEPTLPPKPEVTKTAQEVLDVLKEKLGDSYGCDQDETEARITGYYGLDISKVDSWASQVNSNSSINMDTAIVLKVKEGYAQEAAALLLKAFEQTASYAQMYSMDLYRVSQGRIFISGQYVGYFILGQPGDGSTSEADLAKLAAQDGDKIDKAWEDIFGEKPENLASMPQANKNNIRPEGFVGG